MASIQDYRSRKTDMSSPATDIVPIDVSSQNHTPTVPYRAIMASGAGNIVIDTADTASRTVAVQAGQILPVITTKVYTSGTTATGIYGFL